MICRHGVGRSFYFDKGESAMTKNDKDDKNDKNVKDKAQRLRKAVKNPFGIQVKVPDNSDTTHEDIKGARWVDVAVNESLESTLACKKWIKDHSDMFIDQVVRIIQIKGEHELAIAVKKSVVFS